MKVNNLLRNSRYRYPIILAALVGIWLISPLSYILGIDKYLGLFFITLLVASSAYSAAEHGKMHMLVVVLGLILAILIWFRFERVYRSEVELLHSVVGLIFFSVVVFAMLRDILTGHHKVDLSLIMGAVCVYLLIGVTFEYLFELVFFLNPESFNGVSQDSLEHGPFFYFSIVTLTTLGYGDITPVTRITRSLVSFEAVVGQIYLTVLVARLVGMFASNSAKA